MIRTLLILIVMTLAAPVWAQVVDTPRAFARYCELSNLADANSLERLEERKAQVLSPFLVRVHAPNVRAGVFDPVSGLMSFETGAQIQLFEGHGLSWESPETVRFEVTSEQAELLNARFLLGHAKLEFQVLPVSYADFERSFCETGVEEALIVGHVLSVRLVDEIGQPIVKWTSELGHRINVLRAHRLPTFLGELEPRVSVSGFKLTPDLPTLIKERAGKTVEAELQTMLFTCYVKGLTRHPRLQGALSVSWKTGDPKSPRISVDSLHDSNTSACVIRKISRLAEIQFDAVPKNTQISLTIFMKLDPRKSL